MASLMFDAAALMSAETPLWLTHGRNRSELRWSDRRSYTFQALAQMLSRAEVGPKDGPCYTPAIFGGTARRMDQATQIDVAVLDADCGHTLEEIESAIRAKGWRAIIHSTHSHLTDTTAVAATAFDRWQAETGGTVADYMLAKKGYLPRVVAGAQIVEEVIDGSAKSYIVRHNACPKFRILLPLSAAWLAGDYESQGIANAAWRERIGALAASLGLHHDQSCSDTSRLFYLPRIKAGQEYVHKALEGGPCPIWSLAEARAEQAQGLTPLEAAAAARPAKPHATVQVSGGDTIDLTAWAAEYANRFEIVKALKSRAPGVFGARRSGVKHHLQCPCSADHSSGELDRTGTFAVNASDLARAGLPQVRSGFVICCNHAGCAGKDRLDFLRQMLVDGSLTPGDLVDSAFLTPDIPRINADAIIAAPTRVMSAPVLKQPKPKLANEGNIPAGLYANLPGVLGVLHAWMLETANKQQPVLSLGAALAFCAAAIGQRVILQRWKTRPNVYVLGIAHSGAGKARPIAALKELAQTAGLSDELIGAEDIASDTGIVKSVAASPRQVMLLDEIGFLIQSMNSRQAGPHLQNVVQVLLKLYSSANSSYKGKSYANAERPLRIDQPCVSLYGCSTPGGLTDALTKKDITNGLLSRMVLFDAGDCDPYPAPAGDAAPPEALTDWLRAWNNVSPCPNPIHMVGGQPVIEPRMVLLTQDAYEISVAFAREMEDAKRSARSRGTDAVYVRALENALKFALIRGCAAPAVMGENGPMIDEAALRVDAECMRWACDLSRATVRRMDDASREIVSGPYDAALKDLRTFIERAGERGATRMEISKAPAGKHPKRQLDDLLASLAEAGDVFWVASITTGKRGRPRSAWVHKRFIGLYANVEPESEADGGDQEAA